MNGFEWKKDTFEFDENFRRKNDEDSDIVYVLEIDVKYLKQQHESHNDVLFWPKTMKTDICKKHIGNLFNKKQKFRN